MHSIKTTLIAYRKNMKSEEEREEKKLESPQKRQVDFGTVISSRKKIVCVEVKSDKLAK